VISKAIPQQFGSSGEEFVLQLLFFHFICPVLISPVRYDVISGSILMELTDPFRVSDCLGVSLGGYLQAHQ
jgi:hypothetical protein